MLNLQHKIFHVIILLKQNQELLTDELQACIFTSQFTTPPLTFVTVYIHMHAGISTNTFCPTLHNYLVI